MALSGVIGPGNSDDPAVGRGEDKAVIALAEQLQTLVRLKERSVALEDRGERRGVDGVQERELAGKAA